MSNKDNIKDLFSEKFQNFEAEVDANAWSKIQQGIQVLPNPPVASHSIWSATTIGIAVLSGLVIAVAGTMWLKSGATEAVNNTPVVIENIAKPTSAAEEESQINETEEKATLEVSKVSEPEIKIEQEVSEPLTTIEKTVKTEDEIVEASEEVLETSIIQNTSNGSVSANAKDVTNVISKAPETIIIKDQSKVVASPMGGNAPLTVSFTSMAEVSQIKWKFDDGTESDELAPVHVYEEPGVYFVTMLAELTDGTVTMDKAVVEVKETPVVVDDNVQPSEIFVPNVFTPNGDGENDALIIKVKEVESFTISIYSVNGKLVFTSEDPSNNWSGVDLSGNKLEDGVFYYLVNAIGLDGKVYAPKGYISLRTKN